jgi:hypothetical protein
LLCHFILWVISHKWIKNCLSIFSMKTLCFILYDEWVDFRKITNMTFLNFYLGYFTCDNLLVESSDSSNDSGVLIKGETKWVCSILKLSSSFLLFVVFWAWRDSCFISKISRKFGIVFLHLSQIVCPFWILGRIFFMIQPAQVSGFSWNVHCDWHSEDYSTVSKHLVWHL